MVVFATQGAKVIKATGTCLGSRGSSKPNSIDVVCDYATQKANANVALVTYLGSLDGIKISLLIRFVVVESKELSQVKLLSLACFFVQFNNKLYY